MARSNEAICNVALQRVGVTATIDRLDQRIKEAMVCNQVFEMTRRKVLEETPFPFSRKFSLLAQSGSTPLKWRYRYVYPNDCLHIRSIFPNVGEGYDPSILRRVARERSHPYELALDDTDEKTILTDIENAIIEYTVDIANPSRFTSAFDSMFAWALAGEIALPLSTDVKFASNAFGMYETEKNRVHATALNEEHSEDSPESEFITVRN
jgi:hypothetical protein